MVGAFTALLLASVSTTPKPKDPYCSSQINLRATSTLANYLFSEVDTCWIMHIVKIQL